LSTVSKPFIEELMPQYPIYVDLIQKSARDVIGHVHPETEPAVRLLSEEGFAPTEMVDIFDAGPVLQCATKLINAVQRCEKLRVVEIGDVINGTSEIVSSMFGGFRGQLANVHRVVNDSTLHITTDTAAILGVGVGDHLWCMPPRPSQTTAS